MSSFDNKISTLGDIARSAPNWYTETTIIDLGKVKQEDGNIDLAGAKVSYEEGDSLVVVPFEKKTPEVDEEDFGKVYTVEKRVGLTTYKLKEGKIEGEGRVFLIKFNDNRKFETDKPLAIVPITVEMIKADKPLDKNSLYRKGIRQSGWYKWQMIKKIEKPETKTPKYKIISELLDAMNLHNPPVSLDAVEAFTEQGIELTEEGIQLS